MIWELRHEYNLELLLQASQLPRATYYYHVKRMKTENKYAEVEEQIVNIFHENRGRYGYRRITLELRNRGYCINHKTVQRLMKKLNLVCKVRMKKYRSYKGEVGKIAPNLLERDFKTETPNQKWVTDVTEFSIFGEKRYEYSLEEIANACRFIELTPVNVLMEMLEEAAALRAGYAC